MKIAITSSGLGHVARGIETWATSLAEALAERGAGPERSGVGVTLFAGAPLSAGRRPSSARLAIRVLPCLRRSDPRPQRLASVFPGFTWRWGFRSAYGWEQFSFWWRLWPILRKERFDILHVQDPVVADWCRRFRNAGLVGTQVILANGTEEDIAFLSKFRYVQELSPHYLDHHRKPWPRDFRRWSIPNLVDTTEFSPRDREACRRSLGLAADAYVVLSAGAVNRERKRMGWLVDEFAAVRRDDAVLLLAGVIENQEGRELASEAKARLGGRFRLIENVPHSEMPALYGAADLFVLCSTAEILGIVFLEAMACGVPCIGHTFPVTEWVIGEGGTCVDMTRRGALTAEIEKYVESDFRRVRGRRARERAEKTFSRNVVADQMIRMYEEVEGARRQV